MFYFIFLNILYLYNLNTSENVTWHLTAVTSYYITSFYPLIYLLSYLKIKKEIYVTILSQSGVQVLCHKNFNRLLVLGEKNVLYIEHYKSFKKEINVLYGHFIKKKQQCLPSIS